jgi:arylsulfatase A-like enzyme
MGDNGYFLGERQLAGKWLMYDNSLRVPLILFDPRLTGGKRNRDFALNIDVPATILDFAGIKSPKSWQGTSLLSDQLAKRKDFLTEHLWQVDIIAPSEAIRTERWKYFRYINHQSHEELYDLSIDPLEINNLASDPARQSILKELRAKMEKKIAGYLKDKIE